MNEILEYFPHLTDKQIEQFKALQALYEDWNQKINVISRKDISNLYSHHVLHSLAIAKAINFKDGTTIMDFGTGGGFPGIPLAIMFPNCKFKLIDGTGKKIMVANEVIKARIRSELCAAYGYAATYGRIQSSGKEGSSYCRSYRNGDPYT